MKLRNKKTGEIFDLDKMPKWLKESIQICATFYSRECEVYEPTEPLIKDPKIRKAVRAWAEAIGINGAKYDESWSAFRSNNCTICFKGKYYFGELEDGEDYTITELCGEEEE